MTTETITYQDVLNLEQSYAEAKANTDQIGVAHGYPAYPKVVSKFMLSLSVGKWGNKAYSPSKTQALIKAIETADMLDCRSILTACSRGERFSDGYWISVLKSDVLDKVIARAKILTQDAA